MKKRSLLSAIVVCFLYSCAESEVESNLDSAISDKKRAKKGTICFELLGNVIKFDSD